MIDKSKTVNRAGGYQNRLLKIKVIPGIWAAKLLSLTTRILGRGGTTLPGRVALSISPRVVGYLASQIRHGSMIVSGTNGKTTTSSLITNILQEAGKSCVHNQSGSNMSWGIASALINYASPGGSLSADFAVLEVDEGALPAVTRETSPLGIILTNIFRDQLDRYGEVDRVQQAVKKGLGILSPGAFSVINADDPTLTGIINNQDITTYTYGLEVNLPDDDFQDSSRDLKTCPLCSEKLTYDKIIFAHLGHYHCPVCHFKRPEPDVKLTGYQPGPGNVISLEIDLAGEMLKLNTPLPGIYNIYNLMAAATCAKALKIPGKIIINALEKAAPAFGRMEFFKTADKNITMALVKNPVGANEVLRTLISNKQEGILLIAINDKIADGRDISWLWDVDFEKLLSEQELFSAIYLTGLRAQEMAVRLKYAGINQQKLHVDDNTGTALKQAINHHPGKTNIFIMPNYTAMLEIRHALNEMGLGKAYWEGQ